MSIHLQKHKAMLKAPRALPATPDQLHLVMKSLAEFSHSSKFKKHYEKATKPRNKGKLAAKSKLSTSKPADAKPVTVKKTKFTVDKESEDKESEISEDKESEESEENASEEEDFNYSIHSVAVDSTIVWAAEAGEGRLLLCVGLITKKQTRKKTISTSNVPTPRRSIST